MEQNFLFIYLLKQQLQAIIDSVGMVTPRYFGVARIFCIKPKHFFCCLTVNFRIFFLEVLFLHVNGWSGFI